MQHGKFDIRVNHERPKPMINDPCVLFAPPHSSWFSQLITTSIMICALQQRFMLAV